MANDSVGYAVILFAALRESKKEVGGKYVHGAD